MVHEKRHGPPDDGLLRTAVDALDRALEAHGTAERAAHEQRYLKSSLHHYGTPVPVTRRLVKAFLRGQADLTRPQLRATVEDLWARGVHEARVAAVELLIARVSLLGPDDLPMLERLLRTSGTWALVDGLAPDVVGPLRTRYPEVEATLDAWATDPDFWLRWSALLAFLGPLRGGEAVFERFAQLADAMLEDRAFFIRKAIGWALRERGKCAPDEVYAWLLPRAKRSSGLSVREASKYLSPDQADALQAARR